MSEYGNWAHRPRVRDGLRAALLAMTDAPATVVTDQLDIVAANRLGKALLGSALVDGRPNLARFVFLNEGASRDFYPEWDRVADEFAHLLQAAASCDPHDRTLHRLIGELATSSEPFRNRWSSPHGNGCHPPHVSIRHPAVGELDLIREHLAPRADRGLTLTLYAAQPSSATDERLRILASWSQETADFASLDRIDEPGDPSG
jgi:hypothetical protein